MGQLRAVWSPHIVESSAVVSFCVREIGGNVQKGHGPVSFSFPYGTFDLYTNTKIAMSYYIAFPPLVLLFTQAIGSPPVSEFIIEHDDFMKKRMYDVLNNLIKKLAKTFGGADVGRLNELPRIEQNSPSREILELFLPGPVKDVHTTLTRQGWFGYWISPSDFAPAYIEANIRLYSPAVGFLMYFANHAFRFKHGNCYTSYDFNVNRVVEAVQEKQFDLKQLEAETGDSIVPVGIVDDSAFICIGLTGWFYQAENQAADGKLVWQPIGENAQEAWASMYQGNVS